MDLNPIEAFYQDATILVTGGTGFLGSILVEKLLRCFDVKKIFLLIRSKCGLDVEERMQNFLNLEIFDSLRDKSQKVFDKLEPVEVDYNVDDLNINSQWLKQIQMEVQIIFNVVASVKFNEALKDAIAINIFGTEKVVNMALEIKNLKAFVHVSTIFSNCNRNDIDEKIYDSTLSYNQFIALGKVYGDLKDPKEIDSNIFDNLPNTYTLTKHYAEKLIHHQAFFMPAGIFRPPIVISSYKDLPGYTDNVNGPSGIIAWTVKGYIHCIYGDSKLRSNLVPVDYCINALIATAWDVNERHKQRIESCSPVPIYNYIFNENNITWGQLMDLVPLGFHQPLRKSIWYYSYFIVPSKKMFNVLNFIYHTLPACIMDCLAVSMGQKRTCVKAYRKLERILIMMSFFGKREWNFGNENVLRLTSSTAKMKFQNGSLDFDMKNIDWSEYFVNFIPGIKRYYFKESSENLKSLKSTYERLRCAHLTLKFVVFLIFSKKLIRLLKFLFKILSKRV